MRLTLRKSLLFVFPCPFVGFLPFVSHFLVFTVKYIVYTKKLHSAKKKRKKLYVSGTSSVSFPFHTKPECISNVS